MNRILKNEKGSSIVVIVLVIIIVVLIGGTGWFVYQKHHKSSVTTTTTSTKKISPVTPAQQYLTISIWGVRVPYQGSDTLSVSGQTCAENGDANGDTVNLGCQVTVSSADLAKVQSSCGQQNLPTGSFGYIYLMTSTDNYSYTNGSGYTPVPQYVSQNPGKYSKIDNHYFAFAPLGNASGRSVTGTSGCSTWDAKYNSELAIFSGLISKFEAIR